MKKLVCSYIYDSSRHPFDKSGIEYVDVMNYSFGLIKDGKLDISHLENFDELKKYQDENRKLVLSIGGWGADGFSQSCANDETRKVFIDSILEVVKEKSLDGIDIDWEYPNSGAAKIAYSSDDPVNFTLFLTGLRCALDSYKRGLLLTIAVGADYECVENIEIEKIKDVIDYLNIMTYDMDDENKDGYIHHTNVYSSIEGEGISAKASVMSYHKAGFPLDRIIIGAAAYAKAYTLDPNEEKPRRGYPFGRIEDEKLEETNKLIWDENAHAPLLHLTDTVYLTYDNVRSIEEKCAFIKEFNLAGIMYWEYGSDYHHTLLRTMKANLK